jgi:microcompartment protein CcmK/EutM
MRLGVVRGSVVLSLASPELAGLRLAIVEPIVRESLAKWGGTPGLASARLGGGKPIIAADQLGAAEGQVVGFIEGRTAASPFWPAKVPVDAYCALIADNIDYRPGHRTDRGAGAPGSSAYGGRAGWEACPTERKTKSRKGGS